MANSLSPRRNHLWRNDLDDEALCQLPGKPGKVGKELMAIQLQRCDINLPVMKVSCQKWGQDARVFEKRRSPSVFQVIVAIELAPHDRGARRWDMA